MVPAYLIYIRKSEVLAVSWLSLIVVLDVFNSQQFMNLSAVLLFGMVCIPYLILERKTIFRLNSIGWFATYFLLLTMLGIYHGFFFPWADPTGERGFKDQAQMRTILHLGRTFCEWSVILYLAIQIRKNTAQILGVFLRVAFAGGLILCGGAFLEEVFSFDFYHFFTGGREYLNPERVRGFAYEPRGLSQNLAQVMLILPFVPMKQWKYLAVPLFIYFGIYKTYSFSGVAVFGLGFAVLLIAYGPLLLKSVNISRYKIALGSLAVALMLVGSVAALPKAPRQYMLERLQIISSNGIAEKLEVFDAAAINFLNHNPKYYWLGTGPGLIYLPAGDYILKRDQPIWNNRFEALPHMGLVLILSNAGLLGLCIFVTGIVLAYRRNRLVSKSFMALALCLVAIYFLQMKYLSILGFAILIAARTADDEGVQPTG